MWLLGVRNTEESLMLQVGIIYITQHTEYIELCLKAKSRSLQKEFTRCTEFSHRISDTTLFTLNTKGTKICSFAGVSKLAKGPRSLSNWQILQQVIRYLHMLHLHTFLLYIFSLNFSVPVYGKTNRWICVKDPNQNCLAEVLWPAGIRRG